MFFLISPSYLSLFFFALIEKVSEYEKLMTSYFVFRPLGCPLWALAQRQLATNGHGQLPSGRPRGR